MHVNGRPVAAFDPEGLIFAAGVDSEMVKLYDLRSFDKVIIYLVQLSVLVYYSMWYKLWLVYCFKVKGGKLCFCDQ